MRITTSLVAATLALTGLASPALAAGPIKTSIAMKPGARWFGN
jgi:hypothetical protein